MSINSSNSQPMKPINELDPLVIRSTHPSSSSAISPQITSPLHNNSTSNITSPSQQQPQHLHISNPGTPQSSINRSDSGTFARRPHLGSSGSITRMSDRMQEVVKVENSSSRLNPSNINNNFHHQHHNHHNQQQHHQLQQNHIPNHPNNNNSGGLPIFRNTPQFNPLQQSSSTVASSAPTLHQQHHFQQSNNNFQFSQTIQPQRVVNNNNNLVMGGTDVFN